jgi:hypothetical protein
MSGSSSPSSPADHYSRFLDWSSTSVESDGHIRNTPFRPAIASGSLARIDGVFPFKVEKDTHGKIQIQDLSISVGGAPAKLTWVDPDSIVFQIPPAMRKLPRKNVLVQLSRGEVVIYARSIQIVAAAPAAYFPSGAFATPNAFSGKVFVTPAVGQAWRRSVAFSPGKPIRYQARHKLRIEMLVTGVELRTNGGASMKLFVNGKPLGSEITPAPHLGRQILTFELGPEWRRSKSPLRIDFEVDGFGMLEELRPLIELAV